jgi:pimeloyl-ACP methyl ester carboxylesterase
VGLLAWILETYHAWDGAFSDDEILTQASLYWHTNTIATSFRPYWEFGQGLAERVRRVETPTAVAVFPRDLAHPPRSWAERTYNVVRYTEMPRGGHFAPHQETDLLAADMTAFFDALA